ncbi:MAG: 2-hydroxy-3-oxopropionate reductase [Betaproteobacteria bacterium]|nr:MAG: 2-hydroxy-3-oxopropionate reductase [Betaproteobacteria bacterium]
MAPIGFIGLGIMGTPMALNLLKAGHTLWVYGRRPETMTPLTAAGATACTSPTEVARHSDIIIVTVSDTPDVEQVIFGESGIIHGARVGAIVIDMSTISPTATQAFATRLHAMGVEMLDAPVSGGDVGAINATLSIMVGGQPEVFEQVKPLFEIMGKNIVYIGGHGAGQVAKACNQIVVAITMQAVAEALTFARKNETDPARVRAALMGGFAGSKILEVHGQRMLDHDFKPGFKARLHQKDLNNVLQTARELGLALPATALSMQNLNALVGRGEGDLDSSAVVTLVERIEGIVS